MPPASPQSAATLYNVREPEIDADALHQAAIFDLIGETICWFVAGLLAVLVPVLVVAEIVR